jgi:hypothetical protein
VGPNIDLEEDHPLRGELAELCSGRSSSLPFFQNGDDVVWCMSAPDSDALRQAVSALHAWVLPSFGGLKSGDGFVRPNAVQAGLAAQIQLASPEGYFRWRCPRSKLSHVLEKLRLQRSLEAVRPARARPLRPSLYELRARFASALLVGDRDGAEASIGLLDTLQLETAVNTQFMRIRMWRHFGELERIRNHSDLPHLLAQNLPPRVRAWIDEALGVQPVEVPAPAPASPPDAEAEAKSGAADAPAGVTWADWFALLKSEKPADHAAAELFLSERPEGGAPELSSGAIAALVGALDELFVDDALRSRERSLILPGISQLLEEYVRELEYPRPLLGKFYLSLFRLWGALHAGNSIGREHSHVLLELASVLLKLNLETGDVRQGLEDWWRAKPAPSQLPYALDAIELLERELPEAAATAALWVEVADVIKRSPNSLPPADRELWRGAGARLGFDAATITEYLPPEPAEEKGADILAAANLKHVAIVCLREQQAKQAAVQIAKRSGAKITVVASTSAGAETTLACTADVVLFVWMASTHAVFHAFDGFDKKRFCYVQGTGSSSILRTLDRWVITEV